MGTPGDSPGSESSPPAVARDGCLRRDKNQVCVQRQFLQPVQGIHELDKVSLFSPWCSISFGSFLGEEALWMCCLSCLWFVLWVAPLCGFTLHLWVALAERYNHQSLDAIHMPVLVWLCENICALNVVGFIVVGEGVVCLLVSFFNGSWFYHELRASFRFMRWNRASVWFALYFPPDRRKVLTLNNPCTTLLLSTGTILLGSLERTFPLFQGFSWLRPRRPLW